MSAKLRQGLVIAAIFGAGLWYGLRGHRSEEPGYPVVRVVDGDTIVVNIGDGETKVRLIGVDTPETVHPNQPVQWYGREASAHTHELLDGRRVELVTPPGHESTDRYGRRLAFVYRLPDRLFVNLQLVRDGYGFALTRYPFEGMEQFRQAEREAREARRGLWQKDVTPPPQDQPREQKARKQAKDTRATAR